MTAAFFGVKPSLVVQGGMIAAAAMGDPNASIPTRNRSITAPCSATGKALKTSVTFVSPGSLNNPAVAALGLAKPLVAVSGTRKLKEGHGPQRRHPDISVDRKPTIGQADDVHLVCRAPPAQIAR